MRDCLILFALVCSIGCSGADSSRDSLTSGPFSTGGTTTTADGGSSTSGGGSTDGSADPSGEGRSSSSGADPSSSTSGPTATSTTGGEIYDGEPGEFNLEHDGRAYRLYVPSGYVAREPIPVLVGFHGAGDSGSNFYAVNKALGLNEASEPNNYVVIVPDTKSPYSDFANWSGNPQSDLDEMNAEMDEILLLVDEVAVHYHLDIDRIHAFGFSNGGLFTALTGLEHSVELASLTVLGYGWGGNYFTGAPRRLVPVQFGCGQSDGFFGYAQQAEAFLASQGHATRFVTASGVGHDYIGVLGAMPPADMYGWMQSHSLD